MKLIVGLGNPGARFNFTRHNLGFLALDFYLKQCNGSWSEKPELGAIFSEIKHIRSDGEAEKVIFIKPQDYYNVSGVAVAAYARYYKIEPADIMVICDNFDLEFGKIRYRSKGSSGGNNGLKSVDKELGSTEYARLRIGTSNPEIQSKVEAKDFVLSKFSPEEKRALQGVLSEVSEKINEFIA